MPDTPKSTHTTHVDAARIDSLLAHYDNERQRLGHSNDPAQRQAVEQLDELRRRLMTVKPKGLFGGLFSRGQERELQRGLYLWGGVGRGKTWLMDLFFHSLPFKDKQRSHFHRFMQWLHEELRQHKDRADPLDLVAEQLAKKIRVLCFDEFYVSDIADAMLLGNLFRSLFDRGVTLVATSNCAPDELYKDGLQRVRFLPAIRLLKENTVVLNVDAGVDYRLRHLEHARTWFLDSEPDWLVQVAALFDEFADDPVQDNTTLSLNHRKLKARRLSAEAVWFEFKDICDGPRGQADYIEIGRCYHAVFITSLPLLGTSHENQTRRFVNLVDEFYDRGVKLFITAAASPETIYQGTQLAFEFRRTLSRLTEMQSREYLALPHKP